MLKKKKYFCGIPLPTVVPHRWIFHSSRNEMVLNLSFFPFLFLGIFQNIHFFKSLHGIESGNNTRCSIMKRINFALITEARNKLIRLGMCEINHEVGPFWHISFEKYHYWQSVIIHMWRLLSVWWLITFFWA